jgi:hypothetical protein
VNDEEKSIYTMHMETYIQHTFLRYYTYILHMYIVHTSIVHTYIVHTYLELGPVSMNNINVDAIIHKLVKELCIRSFSCIENVSTAKIAMPQREKEKEEPWMTNREMLSLSCIRSTKSEPRRNER